MVNEDRSFKELVSEAPLLTTATTVTLAGTLSRSDDQGKFILTLGNKRSVTLDVDAVKDHKVLGSAGGQHIVEVEVDVDRLPPEHTSPTQGLMGSPGEYKFKFVWHDPQTVYWLDVQNPPKSPFHDTHPGIAPDVTISVLDNKPVYDEFAGPVAVPAGGDPWGGVIGSRQSVAPFALATAQQAPASAIAAMQAPAPSFIPGGTGIADVASAGTGIPDIAWIGTGIPDIAWAGTGIPDIVLVGTGVPDTAGVGTGIPDVCR